MGEGQSLVTEEPVGFGDITHSRLHETRLQQSYTFCAHGRIWSTWVPNVDKMDAHEHKMSGSDLQVFNKIFLKSIKRTRKMST